MGKCDNSKCENPTKPFTWHKLRKVPETIGNSEAPPGTGIVIRMFCSQKCELNRKADAALAADWHCEILKCVKGSPTLENYLYLKRWQGYDLTDTQLQELGRTKKIESVKMVNMIVYYKKLENNEKGEYLFTSGR